MIQNQSIDISSVRDKKSELLSSKKSVRALTSLKMDLLKKTILMDLKNHFQRKVSHDQLFSCLIYDFLFVQLVIGPLFVVTWRGTWQNADTLFDQVIFQDKLEASSIFVLVLGLVVSAILVFAQHEIKAFALNCNR